MSRLRFYSRVAVLVPVTLIGIPLQWLVVRNQWPGRRTIPMLYHRIVCATLGIRRIVHGAPPRGKAALIVSNHVSWLDICVLSALTPLSFIAKSEVGTWPVVSLLARLQRTLFIDRTRRTDTARTNGAVAERLQAGDAIVLFAEGTTGDGTRVLPFRSALVGAAREALASENSGNLDVVLQPLAITYVRRDGLPLRRGDRPDIAWHGDMDLVPHLKGIMSGGPIDVQLTWGTPIPFTPETDRKQATRKMEEEVRAHVRDALSQGGNI